MLEQRKPITRYVFYAMLQWLFFFDAHKVCVVCVVCVRLCARARLFSLRRWRLVALQRRRRSSRLRLISPRRRLNKCLALEFWTVVCVRSQLQNFFFFNEKAKPTKAPSAADKAKDKNKSYHDLVVEAIRETAKPIKGASLLAVISYLAK